MEKTIIEELEEDRQPESHANKDHQGIFEDGIALGWMNSIDYRKGDILDVVDRVETDVMQPSVAFAKVLEERRTPKDGKSGSGSNRYHVTKDKYVRANKIVAFLEDRLSWIVFSLITDAEDCSLERDRRAINILQCKSKCANLQNEESRKACRTNEQQEWSRTTNETWQQTWPAPERVEWLKKGTKTKWTVAEVPIDLSVSYPLDNRTPPGD